MVFRHCPVNLKSLRQQWKQSEIERRGTQTHTRIDNPGRIRSNTVEKHWGPDQCTMKHPSRRYWWKVLVAWIVGLSQIGMLRTSMLRWGLATESLLTSILTGKWPQQKKTINTALQKRFDSRHNGNWRLTQVMTVERRSSPWGSRQHSSLSIFERRPHLREGRHGSSSLDGYSLEGAGMSTNDLPAALLSSKFNPHDTTSIDLITICHLYMYQVHKASGRRQKISLEKFVRSRKTILWTGVQEAIGT